MFKFDEKQAAGAEFPILPPAEYECIVSKVEVAPGKTSGKPQINATLTIRKDVEQEGGGRKIFDYLTTSKEAEFKFHQFGKALGWEQGREFADLYEVASALLYQPIRVKTKNDTYEGKTNPKVSFYKPAEHEYEGGGEEAGHDPFANDGKPIDISDDDLPF